MKELSYETLVSAPFLRSFLYDGYDVGFVEIKEQLVCVARPREWLTVDEKIIYKTCVSSPDQDEQAERMESASRTVTALIDKRVCEYLERLMTVNAD